MTLSYDKRSPMFLLRENRVLFGDMKPCLPYTPDDALTDMLRDNLHIDYDKAKGSENWVTPSLENVFCVEDGMVVILYSCLIPEQSIPDDQRLEWKSITDILADTENISEYDRKLLSSFALGTGGV